MRTLLLAILFACALAAQASAKVTSMSFEQLARHSDVIAVATVETVIQARIDRRYATAKVMEVWKGTQTERVEFLASPTWTCDLSDAKKGETVLLFLTKAGASRYYTIAHSGRGRMPLHTANGKTYAIFQPDIRPPKSTLNISGLESPLKFAHSVEVVTLRSLVKSALAKPQTSI